MSTMQSMDASLRGSIAPEPVSGPSIHVSHMLSDHSPRTGIPEESIYAQIAAVLFSHCATASIRQQ
jgi:hypothetical protein